MNEKVELLILERSKSKSSERGWDGNDRDEGVALTMLSERMDLAVLSESKNQVLNFSAATDEGDALT